MPGGSAESEEKSGYLVIEEGCNCHEEWQRGSRPRDSSEANSKFRIMIMKILIIGVFVQKTQEICIKREHKWG